MNVEKAGRCTCANDGSAVRCPHHSEADFQAAVRSASSTPALRCDTCSGTGLVDWAPFQQRDSEDDQQPCPDCSRIPSVTPDAERPTEGEVG